MTKLQAIIADLQRELNVQVVSGQITVNIHQGKPASIETKTHQRIDEPSQSA